MNRERWKNTWSGLKESIEHRWGQLNDEMFRPLGRAQGAVHQRLRAILGTKEKAEASNATNDLAAEPLPRAPDETTRDLRPANDQRSNGN